MPANIYPGQLPLTSPRVKLRRKGESKIQKQFCIRITANSLTVRFPLKSSPQENFPPYGKFPRGENLSHPSPKNVCVLPNNKCYV
jgi:hypothetical protein